MNRQNSHTGCFLQPYLAHLLVPNLPILDVVRINAVACNRVVHKLSKRGKLLRLDGTTIISVNHLSPGGRSANNEDSMHAQGRW